MKRNALIVLCIMLALVLSPLAAKPGDPGRSLSREDIEKAGVKRNPGERSIHE